MKIYFGGLILVLFGLCNINAQTNSNNFTDSCNCPLQYTHSEILKGNIKIEKIVVLDSTKYSTLPTVKDNLDSLSKLILYPEFTKRAMVSGQSTYLLTIDILGKVKEVKVKKGIGAGLDEASIDILKGTHFTPAKIENNSVESEVNIIINFSVNRSIDKPEYVLDEIKYESIGITTYFKNTIIFRKDGSANYIHNYPDDYEESIGKINSFNYSKLSDFILSQCFYKMNDSYHGRNTHGGTTTITVIHNNVVKSVSSTGGEYYPIGFWAISNLIRYLNDGIKWEIIKKSESSLKKLPPRDEE